MRSLRSGREDGHATNDLAAAAAAQRLADLRDVWAKREYWRIVADDAGGVFCKPHQRKRNNDYRAGKRAGLPEEEKRKVADAVAESVKRSGYEQSPQRIAARRANFQAWRARNRDYDLERNATWVEQHAERRRLISRQSKQRRARGEWAARGSAGDRDRARGAQATHQRGDPRRKCDHSDGPGHAADAPVPDRHTGKGTSD